MWSCDARSAAETAARLRALVPSPESVSGAVAEILDAVRNTERDPVATPSADWNPTVRALTETIDHAIRDALAQKTLADIVDADVASESAQSTPATPNAPRAISRR
jgi:hypothetical protein